MNDPVRPCNLKPQQRDLTPVLRRPVETTGLSRKCRTRCGIVHRPETKAPLLHDCVALIPAPPGRLLRWPTASCPSKSYKKRARGRAGETEGSNDQNAIYRA